MKTNDDIDALKAAQAASAAKYAHEQEMKTRYTIDLTTGEPLATNAEIAYNLEQLGRHKAALTPSSNIDTETIVDELKTGALIGVNFTYEAFADYVRHKVLADRNKLIKHLAHEMGENYEAMVKIAKTLK